MNAASNEWNAAIKVFRHLHARCLSISVSLYIF